MKNFAMTHDDLTLLQQKLIIPSAVADIIEYDLDVEEEMQYGLHMALSETDPDSALLAIALCARELAEKYVQVSPIAGALSNEANNIINDYAPTWLRYQKGRPMPSDLYEQVLQTVPEDLEALADLLDALAADLAEFGQSSSGCFALADVFSIQARAHMEIALFVLEEMKSEEKLTPKAPEPIVQEAQAANNIILFPTEKR